jgi:hypothetical protein
MWGYQGKRCLAARKNAYLAAPDPAVLIRSRRVEVYMAASSSAAVLAANPVPVPSAMPGWTVKEELAQLAFQPSSLDMPLSSGMTTLADELREEDPRLEHMLGMYAVATHWGELPSREPRPGTAPGSVGVGQAAASRPPHDRDHGLKSRGAQEDQAHLPRGVIAKTFLSTKTFRAPGTNFLRQEKSLRDHGDAAGPPDVIRRRATALMPHQSP